MSEEVEELVTPGAAAAGKRRRGKGTGEQVVPRRRRIRRTTKAITTTEGKRRKAVVESFEETEHGKRRKLMEGDSSLLRIADSSHIAAERERTAMAEEMRRQAMRVVPSSVVLLRSDRSREMTRLRRRRRGMRVPSAGLLTGSDTTLAEVEDIRQQAAATGRELTSEEQMAVERAGETLATENLASTATTEGATEATDEQAEKMAESPPPMGFTRWQLPVRAHPIASKEMAGYSYLNGYDMGALMAAAIRQPGFVNQLGWDPLKIGESNQPGEFDSWTIGHWLKTRGLHKNYLDARLRTPPVTESFPSTVIDPLTDLPFFRGGRYSVRPGNTDVQTEYLLT